MDDTYIWYQALQKPLWAPPSYAFGIAWSIIYPIIFASFGYVFYLCFEKKIEAMIAIPFVLNLIFNFAFTPIQFVLKSNILSTFDILFVVGTLIWAMYRIYPESKPVFYAQFPYLLWGLFATCLQITITYLNW